MVSQPKNPAAAAIERRDPSADGPRTAGLLSGEPGLPCVLGTEEPGSQDSRGSDPYAVCPGAFG